MRIFYDLINFILGHVFLYLLFLAFPSVDNQIMGWDLLSEVQVVIGYDEFMGRAIEKPIFPKSLKEKEGDQIILEGFVIPIQKEKNQDYFVLSRYPYQSCFFCGGAGPETVIEVYSNKKFTFTDERVKVKGKLILNDDNSLHLFYIIEDAEVTRL